MPQKIIITALAFSALFTGSVALAQTGTTTPARPLPVVFPIAELGGCTSKDACRVYCDIAANKDACFAYAQTHGLMTRDQIMLAKKLQTAVGPGGCRGEECKNYCEDGSHAQVCVTFAQQNGFISQDDANNRLAMMRMSSTTRDSRIPVNATGTVSSSTPREHPDFRPGGIIKPPPPPHRGEASSTGQSGSIFFAILHFFGL